MSDKPVYFFGYPSHPTLLAETIRTASRKIGGVGSVDCRTWEDLRVGGRLIIAEILEAIGQASVACFEISSLNENVLFELGYAIGARKHIWPLIDRSDTAAKRRFDRLRLLATVGYVGYENSDNVRTEFFRAPPHEHSDTVFSGLVESSLVAGRKSSVFYLPSNVETDAATQLSGAVRRFGQTHHGAIVADPSEASVYPLSWYAQQIYSTAATVVHLAAERRVDAPIHNARSALIAGLAVGMDRKLLMVAEEDYLAPIDYQHLLYVYSSAKAVADHASEWLATKLPPDGLESVDRQARAKQLDLATELGSIRFGEPVAENEATELEYYFVETSHFRDVVADRSSVFTGRKGSGKTANFLEAARVLRKDRRNLVVTIKPAASELVAATRSLATFTSDHQRNFFVESLWQYLLYTEVAKAAIEDIRSKPVGPRAGTPEWELLELAEDNALGLRHDFAVRLEKALDELQVDVTPAISEEERAAATERLHGGRLQALRRLLGDAIRAFERVPILIDNLDKAWERGADLDAMARVLFGLLTAVGKLDVDFRREDTWRSPIGVTLAVFLRSDIYAKVVRMAREPDKIAVNHLSWSDPKLLLRVIEDRWLADQGEETVGRELWEKYFTKYVGGVSTTDWILSTVIPRPRDIIYLCNAAISNAVNRKNLQVTGQDLLDAATYYSSFALEALLVENGLTIPEMEDVLFEFAGGQSTLTAGEVHSTITRAGLNESMILRATERLVEMSFLGQEVRDGEFAFAEQMPDVRKMRALSARLEREREVPSRYRVHPAYRPYLELTD